MHYSWGGTMGGTHMTSSLGPHEQYSVGLEWAQIGLGLGLDGPSRDVQY